MRMAAESSMEDNREILKKKTQDFKNIDITE